MVVILSLLSHQSLTSFQSPQNGILFPPFRGTGMEKFCISVTFLIPMNSATLSPDGLLTVQKVIYFLSNLIKSSSFLHNFFWNVAYNILIPACQCTCTSLKIRSNPFQSNEKSSRVPCSLNHFTAILPFDPVGLKMKTTIAFMG